MNELENSWKFCLPAFFPPFSQMFSEAIYFRVIENVGNFSNMSNSTKGKNREGKKKGTLVLNEQNYYLSELIYNVPSPLYLFVLQLTRENHPKYISDWGYSEDFNSILR